MSLRDPEFLHSLENFLTTSTLYTEKLLPEAQVSYAIPDELGPFDRLCSECELPLCSKRSVLSCAMISA